MPVPILKQGNILIATVRGALTDVETELFRSRLMDRVAEHRSKGIIIDVTAVDILDSFGARSLQTIARMSSLRGAHTVIVGLQPEVAYSMVQLGLTFNDMSTTLDLEEGLVLLNRTLKVDKSTIGSLKYDKTAAGRDSAVPR